MVTKKILLPECENPKQWYNIVADMPNRPLPPLHPQPRKPMTVDDLSVIFAKRICVQSFAFARIAIMCLQGTKPANLRRTLYDKRFFVPPADQGVFW